MGHLQIHTERIMHLKTYLVIIFYFIKQYKTGKITLDQLVTMMYEAVRAIRWRKLNKKEFHIE